MPKSKKLHQQIESKLAKLHELLDQMDEVRIIQEDAPETWDSDTLYNLATNLKKTLQLLEDKKGKEKDQAIKELQKHPPSLLLTDQLKTKQQELEKLRAKLEETSSELNSLKQSHSTLLDTNLELKHQSLKDWFKEYQKNQELDEELQENIDYASNELERQDETISQLRTQNSKLKLTNSSLQKDLELTTKLAELRRVPLPDNSPNLDYLKYACYGLVAVCFISLLNSSWKKNHG